MKSPQDASLAAGVAKALPGNATSIGLANAGFEDVIPEGSRRNCPPKWWCTMHADAESFRFNAVAGGASGRLLRIERVRPEPWAIVSQPVPAKGTEGRIVRVSADVDASSMNAGEGAGPIVRVFGPGGQIIAHEKAVRNAGQGWGRLSVTVTVPKNAELIDIGVVMYGGGVANFDNILAEHDSP